MLNLLRKEWMVTRWVHIAGAVIGLMLVPVGPIIPQSMPFLAVFCQLIYTHLVFSVNRQAAVSRPDNLLFNSLPVTRDQVVGGKYLFALLCAAMYPLYLCLLLALLSLMGVSPFMPLFALWLLLAASGVLYHLLLMPVSFVDARYGAAASMLIYMALIIVPQRIGKEVSGEQITAFFGRIGRALGGWAAPMLLLATLAVVGLISLTISRRVYRRAEF